MFLQFSMPALFNVLNFLKLFLKGRKWDKYLLCHVEKASFRVSNDILTFWSALQFKILKGFSILFTWKLDISDTATIIYLKSNSQNCILWRSICWRYSFHKALIGIYVLEVLNCKENTTTHPHTHVCFLTSQKEAIFVHLYYFSSLKSIMVAFKQAVVNCS